MIVQYGNFRFPLGTVGMATQYRVREASRGVPFLQEVSATVTGKLFNPRGNTQVMDDHIAAMTAAFSIRGGDFGLLYDDGRRTTTFWRNRDSIGGINVKAIGLPGYQGSERVTYCSVQIEMSGIFLLPVRVPLYLEFTESINIEGGGPLFGVREVNYGWPIRHRLRTHTKCTATQSGSATGWAFYPPIPPPMWPFALTKTFPNEGLTGPTAIGSGNDLAIVNHQVNWSYEYEWVNRLFGEPHYAI